MRQSKQIREILSPGYPTVLHTSNILGPGKSRNNLELASIVKEYCLHNPEPLDMPLLLPKVFAQ